jgi:hypothetical protein
MAVLVVSALVRLFLIQVTIDFEDDSYIRFFQSILLSREPWNIAHNWVWPPLFQYIEVAIIKIGGSLFTVRVITSGFGLFSIALVYLLALELGGSPNQALWACIAFAANPLVIIYDTLAMTETLFGLLLLASYLLFIRQKYFYASIPLALSTLTRYESWFLFIGLVLFYVIWDTARSKDEYVSLRKARIGFVVLPALAIFVWLYLNRLFFGDFLRFATETRVSELTEPDILSRVQVYFPGSSLLLPSYAASILRVLLYPLVYPLIYVSTLLPLAFKRILAVIRLNEGFAVLVASAAILSVSLTVLLLNGTNVGFARYGLPVVSIYAIIGGMQLPGLRSSGVSSLKGFSRGFLTILIAYLVVSSALVSSHYLIGSRRMTEFQEAASWLSSWGVGERILCEQKPIIIMSRLPIEQFYFAWMVGGIHTAQDLKMFVQHYHVRFVVSYYDYGKYLPPDAIVFASTTHGILIYDLARIH